MESTQSNKGKILLISLLLILVCFIVRGQFIDGASGLLQMPSAEMNKSGTFMISGNFMNAQTLPADQWGYNTFGYGIDLTFWQRLEIYYTCVILDGKRKPNPSERDLIMMNQDRHLGFKLQLLRTGDFGKSWLPDVAVGINDFDAELFTGGSAINNFFSRVYAVASKRFPTTFGDVGAHIGYQFNNWTYYSLTGPMVAVDWMPVWLQKENVVKTKFIAEYDARTFNVGAIVSLWRDHFDVMIELQAMKWVSAGFRFKTVLKS